MVVLGVQGLSASSSERDSLTVSLLTCAPGAEVYSLCGHSAVRIRNAEMDSVWNYGLFNFKEPNFIYRFVKGETDYMLGGYPFEWFLPEYMAGGRAVTEQELNLTQDEARKLLAMLREESLPQNRVYRYNYVRDNCATRIIDRLDSATNSRIFFVNPRKYGNFRNEMRAYHKDYPWYQFGIDLALGSGLDKPISAREEMFVPVEMMNQFANAKMGDGRKLVRSTVQLLPDSRHATLPPTPWWASPLFCCSLFLVTASVMCWWQWRRRRILASAYVIWFSLLGITGCVSAFLVFVSEHEATSPNLLLLWLNPLQLLLPLGIMWRRLRRVAWCMACYNTAVLTFLLIFWPMQLQSANPAFFPLMGATLIMAACYAIITPKIGYNTKNEKNNKYGAARNDSHKRVRRSANGASGKTNARGRNRR